MTHVECSYDPCSSNFIDNVNDNTGATVFARAKHSFEGRNNDELSFRKGDVITVSQQLEGGWWEGTLRSNTGWFPSSYVVIIPDSERFLRSRIANNLPSNMPSDVPVLSVDLSRQSYRQQIMKGFVISEQNYANAIANFHTNILMKIKNSSMISDVEFSTLAGNLQFLVLQQNELLEQIKETVENDGYLAKIGGILLLAAPSLRYLHRSYCENHPRAVDLILRNRNKFEKIMSETGSSFNVLIHELSSPFRHLESYPSILNELERCMNAAHPDKGDTQRAASVFRDIVNECCFIRKQKEAQLELMHSDLVEGITSDQMKEFGEIIYMGIASVGVNEFVGDIIPLEKYLVLFSYSLTRT